MTGEALGSATDDEWDQFWLDLQEIVCIIHEKIVGEPSYINGVAMLSDANGLLKAATNGGRSFVTAYRGQNRSALRGRPGLLLFASLNRGGISRRAGWRARRENRAGW